jgi:hypothetical protein
VFAVAEPALGQVTAKSVKEDDLVVVMSSECEKVLVNHDQLRNHTHERVP